MSKEQALNKMMNEMMEEHSPSEDRVHNYLCEQSDDELFKGILEEGKSIKKSLSYCESKAIEFASNNVAIIDDDTVFQWVKEYFINQLVEIDNSISSRTTSKIKKENKKVKEESKADLQMSLF